MKSIVLTLAACTALVAFALAAPDVQADHATNCTAPVGCAGAYHGSCSGDLFRGHQRRKARRQARRAERAAHAACGCAAPVGCGGY